MREFAATANKSNPRTQVFSKNSNIPKSFAQNTAIRVGFAHFDPGRIAIQAKLKVSRPGDMYEQEADRIAKQVMRMPADGSEPPVKEHNAASLGRKCKSCEKRKEEEEQLQISRKETTTSSSGLQVPESTEEYIGDMSGQGSPLDTMTRDFMESRFGFDFGKVRIHTDEKAARSAESIDALAYTIGSDVVFNVGKYEPGSDTGKKLLAHELAHVIQQSNSVQRATVMRQRTPSSSHCGSEFDGKWIERVVVEQEGRQSVTLHWSDGSLDSDICSTGKGHCCVDPSMPEGVAGSVARSRVSGSNLTPITQGQEYRIRELKREHNTWQFWSTFVPERGIALHQHSRVGGEPLSHGCVRLHEPMARKIHCGSRRDQTRVEVRGFARPLCTSDALAREWADDFRSAATPTDGEGITPAIRRGILDTRATLRRAFGVTERGLDLLITDLRRTTGPALTSPFDRSVSIEGVKRIIPRCEGTAEVPTVEERRGISGGSVIAPDRILASSRFNRFLPQLMSALVGAGSMRSARRIVRQQGLGLWEAATARARGSAADTDDRPSYWARLQMTRALRQWQPSFRLNASGREELIVLFERASRGMESARFGRRRENVKRILISGFDPFQLDVSRIGGDIRRGNPSGAAILALDGQRITGDGVSAEIQGVIFPVRFADFDAGRVEAFFRPYLSPEPSVDMIMTISMGGGPSFEVEEFAGRRRSGGLDNLGRSTTASGEPPGLGAGPEFIRTTLPVGTIRKGLGRTEPLPGETEIIEIPAGSRRQIRVERGGPSPGSTAVRGSGGGYLSNEIFYRTSLLRLETGADIPVGHLHTPLLLPPAGTGISSQQFEGSRNQIVRQILDIIRSTLPAL